MVFRSTQTRPTLHIVQQLDFVLIMGRPHLQRLLQRQRIQYLLCLKRKPAAHQPKSLIRIKPRSELKQSAWLSYRMLASSTLAQKTRVRMSLASPSSSGFPTKLCKATKESSFQRETKLRKALTLRTTNTRKAAQERSNTGETLPSTRLTAKSLANRSSMTITRRKRLYFFLTKTNARSRARLLAWMAVLLKSFLTGSSSKPRSSTRLAITIWR